MTPDALAGVRAAAPDIERALAHAGLSRLVVSRDDGVRVRTPCHAEPQLLHDIYDVPWVAAEIARAGV